MTSNTTPTTNKIKLWLAPLAGLTDIHFRSICKIWQADLMITEMVSADGLIYSYQRSVPYARFSQDQRPCGIQIFGSDPHIMAKGCQKILDLNPDFININMGCPVKKVVKRGAGSALMQDTPRAAAIVEAVKNVCRKADIPLSVKIRAGWDAKSINAPAFAYALQNAGADNIILHPRTRSQMYAGKSDWNLIKKTKEGLSIPLIGNGDVFGFEDARDMLNLTACDGIMIGRGAVGKPWIFKQIKNFWNNGSLWMPDNDQVLFTIKQHLQMVIEARGQTAGLKEMRTHLAAYTKGYKGAAQIRKLINTSTDIQEIISALENLIS